MKKFYASKTFWFFLLALLVNVAGVFGFAGRPTAAWRADGSAGSGAGITGRGR